MFIKNTILLLLLIFVALAGCPQNKFDYDLQWSVSEGRTTISGILTDCSCSVADIEMLVTDENTGQDFVSNFTVDAGIRFERPVGVLSDWLSIDLKITDVR